MASPDKAILFDKDGTLFCFSATWGVFFERLLSAVLRDDETKKNDVAYVCGYDRKAKVFFANSLFVSGSSGDVLKEIQRHCPDRSINDLKKLGRELAIDLPLEPVCDLKPFLMSLKQGGYTLGVATNDFEAIAINQLKQSGCFELFDFVCGSDSGFGKKPEAGMVDAFCRSFSIRPEDVVFVGDSIDDLVCAEQAGAGLKVGVLSGPAKQGDLEPFADIILPSIADLHNYLMKYEKSQTA